MVGQRHCAVARVHHGIEDGDAAHLASVGGGRRPREERPVQVVHAEHAQQHRVAHARGAGPGLGGGTEEEAHLLVGGGRNDAPVLLGVVVGVEHLLLLDGGGEDVANGLAAVVDDRGTGDDVVATGTRRPIAVERHGEGVGGCDVGALVAQVADARPDGLGEVDVVRDAAHDVEVVSGDGGVDADLAVLQGVVLRTLLEVDAELRAGDANRLEGVLVGVDAGDRTAGDVTLRDAALEAEHRCRGELGAGLLALHRVHPVDERRGAGATVAGGHGSGGATDRGAEPAAGIVAGTGENVLDALVDGHVGERNDLAE